VPDGEVGLLFPMGDVRAMAEGALQLLADEPRRLAMAMAARARVEAHYRIKPAVDRYERYYRRVLAKR
jgi:glycosyltransferase involved in cell wall biosynthesis